MKGLLAAVRKYPVGDVDPFENFVTEALCWVLQHNSELSKQYPAWVFSEAAETFQEMSWSTQVSVPRYGVMDLVGENDGYVVIFEHKTGSKLTKEQLDNYRRAAAHKYKNKRLYLASVTDRFVDKKISDSAKCITWAQVVTWANSNLDRLSGDSSEPSTALRKFALIEFLDLLISEGMGPMKVLDNDAVKNYCKIAGITPALKQLFTAVSQDFEWRNVYEAMPRTDKKTGPRSVRMHWGRIGIEFTKSEDWRPGIFFGVLLDGEDHCVEPINPDLGPDLCVIFSFDYSLRDKYPTEKEYINLKQELAEWTRTSGEGWQLFDHLAGSSKEKNRWHPLYLRQPLSTVLANADASDEQIAALRKKLDGIVSLLFTNTPSAKSFHNLRKKLAR